MTAYTSIVAVREVLPGKPLGTSVPISVRTGILMGWGAAVAAPWPMPVAAVFSATTGTGRAGVARRALVCAGIGIAGIVGILIEPNTYDVGSWTPPTRRAVFAHTAACAVLAAVGIVRYSQSSRAEV